MSDVYTLMDEQTEETAEYSLDSDKTIGKSLPKDKVTNRAVKAAVATGGDVKELEKTFSSPEAEAMFRDNLARQAEIDFRQQKLDMLDALASDGKPVDKVKAQMILALTQDDLKKPLVDDELEKRFSENAYRLLVANTTNDAYVKSMDKDPETTSAYQDVAVSFTTTMEYILKLHEDNNDWDETSIPGFIWNIGEQFIPFKSAWNKFDSEAYGIATGDNMSSQVENLWLLPTEERNAKIKERYDLIKSYNPLDAQEWLMNVYRYGQQQSTIDNVFDAVDAASLVPVGTLAKGIKGAKTAAKGVDPALEAAFDVTRKLTDLRREEGVVTEKLSKKLFGKDIPELKKKRDELREQIRSLEEKRNTKESMKTAAKVLATENLDAVKTLANSGNVAQAVDVEVSREIRSSLSGGNRLSDAKALENKLMSMYNPGAWIGDSKNLSGEASRRILEGITHVKDTLKKIHANPTQALRYTEEALQSAVEATRSKLRTMYVNASDSVIDARWKVIRQEDTESQVSSVVMSLGDTNALPFKTADDAAQAADHLYQIPDKAYTVENVGNGYVVEVSAPIDETSPAFTSLLVTTNNQTPKSVANTLLGFWRTPEDLLSPLSRQNRNVVTPLAQETARIFQEALAPSLELLTKEQSSRLNQIMKINRDFQKGDERGRWFDSVAEYEQTYYDTFKAWPTEAETAAYMAVREMSDFDWAVRSLTIYRDRKSQGLMRIKHKFRVEVLDEGVGTAGSNDPSDTVWKYKLEDYEVDFNGKQVDSLPIAEKGDNPGVFILEEGASAKSKWSLLSDVDRKEIDKLVKEQGYRIYQTESPLDRPFKMLKDGDQDASFVIFKGGTQRNLDVTEQLPYGAGFHVEYPPGFYTKVPMFYRDKAGRRIYGSDKSLMFHTTEAQAKKYYKAFDEARLLLKDGKTDELAVFLKNNLPHSLQEFTNLYTKGGLDVDVPVFYTKSGQSTREASKQHLGANAKLFDGAVDLNESKYNLGSAVNRKFAQEKNIELPSVEKGAEGNPVFSYRGSHTIDPLSTMNRAMHQLVRMTVYDNYQKQAISTFIEEFANPLTNGGSVTKRSIDSIRKNPISFILDPMWETDVLDKAKLAAAKNSHRALVNLLGMPSDLSRNLDWINNKLLNFVYNKFGDSAVEKVADFAHTKLTDPAKYARSLAFHKTLGLFIPTQLFLQGQSIVHAIAVTGNISRSYKAGAGASLMRLLSLTDNPNVIKGFAKKAKFFGWNEGDFEEAFRLMRETGVWNVEGDVASLDDMTSAKLFSSRGQKFLDKGTIFFKEGERFVRLNAFNTAYLEWKATNVGKKLDMRELSKVLTRYDDLALNMTRKSTAAFQQGIFSLPTQFSTYQIHLMEQLLGKRLTKAEKARALTTYSALYGLPVGLTAAVPLWPFGQDIKQAALERGIDTNDGVMDLLVNGIMSNALELATGKETNIGERYGPSGLSFIKDAVKGDKTMVELFFGPSGQASADFVSLFGSFAPLFSAMADADPNSGNTNYPLLPEDILQRLRTISSVNNAVKFYVAANHSKFISKNEMYQVDADAMDGVLSGLFGVDPRSLSESYIMLESVKEVKAYKEQKMRDVSKNLRRAAENANNPEEHARYIRAARLDAIDGGLTPRDWQRAMENAVSGMTTSFGESMNEQFIRSAPPNEVWKRREFILNRNKEKN